MKPTVTMILLGLLAATTLISAQTPVLNSATIKLTCKTDGSIDVKVDPKP
jgi:hypothetical protein